MKRLNVPCFVDIEQSPDSLHAHAIPENIEIRPGDCVQVHGAPSRIPYGGRIQFETRATVTRANAVIRAWTLIRAPLELLELFEVGFQPKESP
jgi:hypothetical protein